MGKGWREKTKLSRQKRANRAGRREVTPAVTLLVPGSLIGLVYLCVRGGGCQGDQPFLSVFPSTFLTFNTVFSLLPLEGEEEEEREREEMQGGWRGEV